MSASGASLRDGLEGAEAERFGGRDGELAAITAVAADPAGGVVFVHGPAGVGKSALVAAVRRAAAAGGRATVELSADPEAALAELLAVAAMPRPLVVLDDFDRAGAGAGTAAAGAADAATAAANRLRETLLPALPDGAVLVLASRRPPPPALLAGPLGSAVHLLELAPLDRAGSLALLAGHGVGGEAAAAAAARAQGYPAALVLAAADGAEPPPAAVIARLAGSELDGFEPEVLALAALCRTVDRRALEALPTPGDPGATMRALRRLSVATPRPGGVELQPLLRAALLEQLRREEPDREREVRRLLADHLHLRARAGELWQLVELAELIEDPAVRWGFGGGGDPELRADLLRPEELPLVEEAVRARGGGEWWETTRRWLTEVPASAVVVRGGDGELRGLCVSTSLARLPEWGREDPVIGGWIGHAEAAAPLGDAILWREAIAFGADGAGRVRALLNATATLRSGLANPRWFYGSVDPSDAHEAALAAALGASHLTDLDVTVGGRRLECHRIDHGPGGVIGLARDIVYRELGLPLRRPPSADEVKLALRSLRAPADLGSSPLTAAGLAPAEQRREVRARLSAAADQAFGEGSEERLLRAVLDYAYLRPDAVPVAAPAALNVSRATYYRRLAVATDRLVAQLAVSY